MSCWNLFLDRISPLGRATSFALKYSAILFIFFFALGNILKTDVRKIAEAENLVTYDKKDSTGICFIGERPFPEFLKNYLPEDYGEIVDENDEVIGEHRGLYFYTIGQRQGLGIGGMKKGKELELFTIKH